MYKLKGQSSNMQTGQSFENKELVCLADPSSWFVRLVRPAGPSNWVFLLVCQSALIVQVHERLVKSAFSMQSAILAKIIILVQSAHLVQSKL